jgi:hypothetical protein
MICALCHKKKRSKNNFRFFDIYRIILVPQFGEIQVRYLILKTKYWVSKSKNHIKNNQSFTQPQFPQRKLDYLALSIVN